MHMIAELLLLASIPLHASRQEGIGSSKGSAPACGMQVLCNLVCSL